MYSVAVPITGYIVVEVNAETEEEAFDLAFESEFLTLDNIEEWEAHTEVTRGNISYAIMKESRGAECTKYRMIEQIKQWREKLENAWNSCELDNDVFVQQALNIMNEMRDIISDVEMFEKE